MTKTTVYLDEEHKAALALAAEKTGRKQSDLIRDGIDHVIHQILHTRPALQPASDGPRVLDRADELMAGFGS
ncbi:MAG: ribbon-helix-helix protein, CopG family [Propionibacteriaceae bacterium]|jgi:predicted transcriptional regulator|nr:ribbon-helix-helix protein, CopG family [Propionibacteriaceae bacterium]